MIVTSALIGYPLIFMLAENKLGNYSFLKGIAPYSAGVVAEAGFEIVHVRLSRYVPLRLGFDAIDAHLGKAGRPVQAICGMELRSPKPFSFTGFNEFNAGYVDVLKKWNLLVDGINPVARTNVAPAVNPPQSPHSMASPTRFGPTQKGRHLWLRAQASCRKAHLIHTISCGRESPARPQSRRRCASSSG